MKKIAIVRYNLSKIGGAEKVAINMANELSQYYDVKLLSILLDEDGFINYDINPNVTLINFHKGDLRIRTATLKLTGKLRDYIKREKIEVIFSITPLTNTMVRLATLGLNVKIVFCDHHSLEFRDFRSREVQRFVGAKFFDKILQEEIGGPSARRPLRLEGSSENQTSRPQPSAPEPNSGAPGASTSGAGGKSPLIIRYVPSVDEYTSRRPIGFDERLRRFKMPSTRWGDHLKEFYFTNLGDYLGRSRMGSGPPEPIPLGPSAYIASSWFRPSDSYLGDDAASIKVRDFARAELGSPGRSSLFAAPFVSSFSRTSNTCLFYWNRYLHGCHPGTACRGSYSRGSSGFHPLSPGPFLEGFFRRSSRNH